MEQVDSNDMDSEKKPKRDLPPIERVTLGKDESDKVDQWLKQADDVFKGLIKLNKSDFINFLVREHKETLSKKELKQLKALHFDQVKFATWALSKLKEAKKNGDTLTYKDLVQLHESIDKVQSTEEHFEPKPKKVRARKPNNENEKNETPLNE